MKVLLTIALFLFSSFLIGEEKKEYMQYESILITPDYKNLEKLSNNMAKHNKKYHSSDPYRARVYNVTTGTDVGKLYWIMGATTFAHLDNRPSDGGHDKDWQGNIMPYVTKLEHGEYWRFMEDMVIDNHKDWEENPLEIWLIRYMSVTPGEGSKIKDLLAKVKATIDKSGKAKFWGVMDNQFIQGKYNGRHLMGISGSNSWADMDDDWNFKKHFEGIHGEGSMEGFNKEMEQVFSNSWQETQVLNKKMSGME